MVQHNEDKRRRSLQTVSQIKGKIMDMDEFETMQGFLYWTGSLTAWILVIDKVLRPSAIILTVLATNTIFFLSTVGE